MTEMPVQRAKQGMNQKFVTRKRASAGPARRPTSDAAPHGGQPVWIPTRRHWPTRRIVQVYWLEM